MAPAHPPRTSIIILIIIYKVRPVIITSGFQTGITAIIYIISLYPPFWAFPVHQRSSTSQYPSGAGVPSKHRRFYLHTPDRILGGLWRQAAQSTNNTNYSFILLRICKSHYLLIWDFIIYNSGYKHQTNMKHSRVIHVDNQINTPFSDLDLYCSLWAPETNWLSPVSPLGPPLVVAGTCNYTRFPRQPGHICLLWAITTIYTPTTL